MMIIMMSRKREDFVMESGSVKLLKGQDTSNEYRPQQVSPQRLPLQKPRTNTNQQKRPNATIHNVLTDLFISGEKTGTTKKACRILNQQPIFASS